MRERIKTAPFILRGAERHEMFPLTKSPSDGPGLSVFQQMVKPAFTMKPSGRPIEAPRSSCHGSGQTTPSAGVSHPCGQ